MKLERLQLVTSNRPCDVIRYWHEDNQMLLDPPYQRGNVWGVIRQRNLIRSLIQNIPIPSIIINDRWKAGWDDTLSCVVIDGKQRMTTFLQFFSSELEIPGEWLGMVGMVTFDDLDLPTQRSFRQMPLAFSEGTLKSLEDEKMVFDLVNFGGVPQGESDL